MIWIAFLTVLNLWLAYIMSRGYADKKDKYERIGTWIVIGIIAANIITVLTLYLH